MHGRLDLLETVTVTPTPTPTPKYRLCCAQLAAITASSLSAHARRDAISGCFQTLDRNKERKRNQYWLACSSMRRAAIPECGTSPLQRFLRLRDMARRRWISGFRDNDKSRAPASDQPCAVIQLRCMAKDP